MKNNGLQKTLKCTGWKINVDYITKEILNSILGFGVRILGFDALHLRREGLMSGFGVHEIGIQYTICGLSSLV